jgi:hypothetical protein
VSWRAIAIVGLGLVLLGAVLPLRYPQYLVAWFLVVHGLIAIGRWWWMPSRGIPLDRRAVGGWAVRAGVGLAAVLWATSRM